MGIFNSRSDKLKKRLKDIDRQIAEKQRRYDELCQQEAKTKKEIDHLEKVVKSKEN